MPAVKRIAFTLIGDGAGTGIYNYLLNLLSALSTYGSGAVTPVLFVGTDVPEKQVASFREEFSLEVVRSEAFDADRKSKRLLRSLLIGTDSAAWTCFESHNIDVVFESATFFGRRFPLPVIAWLPDFQHRHLPALFSKAAYWKREFGFRAQISNGRTIMLSSEDARNDCERFYPRSRGSTSVVRFAVQVAPTLLAVDPVQVVREHGLPEKFFYLPNQFWKHKNHRVVIEALAILKRDGCNFVVAATGKPGDARHPEHYDSLQKLVAQHGLKDNFRFLGLVPRTHVVALLRACTALINPSLFEGWSTTVEESKSLGVPMLLSNLNVHREQVGDAARFFEPHRPDQVATLMREQAAVAVEDRRLREAVALEQSRARLREFSSTFVSTVHRAVGAVA